VPDTGTRNLSKIYNDEWMRQNQYLEPEVKLTAEDVLRRKKARELLWVKPSDSAYEALRKMKDHDISQVPVFEDGAPIGAIYEDNLMDLVLAGRELKSLVVREVMGKAFPVVQKTTTLDRILSQLSPSVPAVFVEIGEKKYDILTKYDLVQAIAGITGA
jgi:cystathionine beta-synthase